MGVTLKVTDLSTGKTIASTWNTGERECWITAKPVIAQWFGVAVDEVSILDTEDGDVVTVDGKIVAEMRPEWDRVT